MVSCLELDARLGQHLNKEFLDSFTSKAEDWVLFLSIDNLNYKQSRSIEFHIKRMKSVVYINNLKRYPEMITSLLLKYAV